MIINYPACTSSIEKTSLFPQQIHRWCRVSPQGSKSNMPHQRWQRDYLLIQKQWETRGVILPMLSCAQRLPLFTHASGKLPWWKLGEAAILLFGQRWVKQPSPHCLGSYRCPHACKGKLLLTNSTIQHWACTKSVWKKYTATSLKLFPCKNMLKEVLSN